jgi:hypothetical protein
VKISPEDSCHAVTVHPAFDPGLTPWSRARRNAGCTPTKHCTHDSFKKRMFRSMLASMFRCASGPNGRTVND